MLRRFSINFALLSMLLDGMLVGLSLYLSAALRPHLNRVAFFEAIVSIPRIPGLLYVLFPALWIVIYLIFSLYDGRKFLRVVDEFSTLTLATIIAAVSAAGILYLSFRDISRVQFILFVILVYLGVIGWRVLARAYFRLEVAAPRRKRRVVVVGCGPLGDRVRSRFQLEDVQAIDFVGYIDDMAPVDGRGRLLGGIREAKQIVAREAITDVVIALPHSASQMMREVVLNLEDVPIHVWVALGFFDLTLYNTAIEDFAGIPMLDLRASAIDEYQRLIKRAFDFTLSALALLLTAPLMALAALLILLDDGMPILFRQKRAGENGREFEMLKFRTMVRDAEKLRDRVAGRDSRGRLIHKFAGDPRVTRIGRLLRRFSLDELPQFLNVLRGDMSLVGPRPELPYLVDQYQPWQRKRFSVPPGITGWWQVSGRSDKPMHLHTEDDLYYIQNYSIFLDIQILMKTVWVVLIGRGAY